jgi:hypothetical protein
VRKTKFYRTAYWRPCYRKRHNILFPCTVVCILSSKKAQYYEMTSRHLKTNFHSFVLYNSGDEISSLTFVLTIESSYRNLKQTWRKRQVARTSLAYFFENCVSVIQLLVYKQRTVINIYFHLPVLNYSALLKLTRNQLWISGNNIMECACARVLLQVQSHWWVPLGVYNDFQNA